MALETFLFDTSEPLETKEAETEFLADALESGDAKYIAHAFGVVARARGMTSIAAEVGVSREAVYQALCELDRGNPTALQKLLTALGVAPTTLAAE